MISDDDTERLPILSQVNGGPVVTETEVYGRRWYVLFVFCLGSVSQVILYLFLCYSFCPFSPFHVQVGFCHVVFSACRIFAIVLLSHGKFAPWQILATIFSKSLQIIVQANCLTFSLEVSLLETSSSPTLNRQVGSWARTHDLLQVHGCIFWKISLLIHSITQVAIQVVNNLTL